VKLDDITGIDRDEWANDADREVAPDHPTPDFWRMLVMPVKPRKISKGGIVIPEEAQTNATYLNYVGKVIAMGPLAYKSDRFAGVDPPKPGDFVIYGRYAGQPLDHRGTKLLIVNDDEILARVTDPESLKIYI
jgi:co-chaperonin GroES (HSP10)